MRRSRDCEPDEKFVCFLLPVLLQVQGDAHEGGWASMAWSADVGVPGCSVTADPLDGAQEASGDGPSSGSGGGHAVRVLGRGDAHEHQPHTGAGLETDETARAL